MTQGLRPVISVIIPTRNRAPLLAKVLDKLAEQTAKPDLFEVIVADNGSTDLTPYQVEIRRSRFSRLVYIYDDRPGLHVGRHTGMRNARGEILVYGDDDIEPFPTWLQSIYEVFRDPEVKMVGGKCLPRFEVAMPAWLERMWAPNVQGNRYLGFLSILDFGDEIREISPTGIIGCNFSIRKEALLDAGGFHPDSMPEEMLRYRGDGESWVNQTAREKAWKAVYHPEASVYHWVPASRMTLEYLYQRAFREGVSMSFREIRRLGHPDGVRERAIRRRKRLKQWIKWMIRREPFPDEAGRILLKGKSDGYEYHQREVSADASLLEWVLKPDYF